MFQKEEKGKRKYQCFVCGQQFEDFDEFKNHIVDKHEEGREYIVCPLAHCQVPVRDMKMHFKAIHPGQVMPEKGQLRAMIWKDFKDGKAKTNKPNFRQGWYDSTKMKKTFKYRSGWELSVYELLDADGTVLAYEAEPFQIDYVYRGEGHKYTPDLLVLFSGGNTELWEIKPINQTAQKQNQDKWDAAELMCGQRGWKFVVVTEQVIKQLQQKIVEQNTGLNY